MLNQKSSRRRLLTGLVAVVLIVGAFVVRLVDIQVVKASTLNLAATAQQRVSVTLPGTRGDIVDSTGTVLATSVERWNITAAPNNVSAAGFTRKNAAGERETVSTAEAIAEIADVTGASADSISSALTKNPSANYALLVKGVTLDVFNRVLALEVPWIYTEAEPSRSYPLGAVTGNLVGFVRSDGVALAGVERSDNSCVAGTNGTASYTRGADGIQIPGTRLVTKAAKQGGTLELTINSDLSWFIEQTLAQQQQIYGFTQAYASVVDVKTGELRAAVDWPGVDSNDPGAVPAADRGSGFFTQQYEPGSIMKPATAASLLDAGVITPETQVVVPSQYRNAQFPKGAYIRDVFLHGTMHWTATGIIQQSSNIGISVLSERLSLQQRHDYLAKFGFGTKTAVGFVGESSGLLHSVAKTDPITDKAQQFGQGIAVTAAQLASMYQTIGNNGVQLPLTLVAGCRQADGSLTDKPSSTGTKVVSASAANQTLQMMESVVEGGPLAGKLQIPGYRIAAKTGTAQVATASGGYGSDRIVSIAGITTVDNPRYAVIVTYVKPARLKSSAAVADGFTAIMKQVIKTYGVTPSTTPPGDLPTTW